MIPYYSNGLVDLYFGDCRDVLPRLVVVPDSCVTDPPYNETSAEWDRWPSGWIRAVSNVLPQSASLWSFGSARMFLDRRDDFEDSGWRFAQELLWLKRNGSGPTGSDRLVKVHEWAYQWYRGRWNDIHHEWERVPYWGPSKGTARKMVNTAAHQSARRASTWVDDGTRQPRSVVLVEAPSVRYQKRHQDEKPVLVAENLVREGTPPGGLVLDCFAGSGAIGVAAIRVGRRALLIEKYERSCEVIARRLEEELDQAGVSA